MEASRVGRKSALATTARAFAWTIVAATCTKIERKKRPRPLARSRWA